MTDQEIEVTPGQVWEDNNPKSTRTLLVVEWVMDGYANVLRYGSLQQGGLRRTRIKLSTLLNDKRYKLFRKEATSADVRRART